MDWFAVDKEGLARLLERKGKASAVLELIQNAWDEEGVTEVNVTLHDSPSRGRSLLIVEDDAPDGFADLTHAFTLFAPSGKVTDAAKRGRFNLGEKLVLAICDSATVVSTRGGWDFTAEGRKRLRKVRARGSRIEAIIRLTATERAEVFRLIESLLPPEGITTFLNGVPLSQREPVRTFSAFLPTEIADFDGILRRTRRRTQVRLFEPVLDETPHLYEMGIPVVEVEGRWHIDIAQKVPLTFERDNVTPAYQREVRVAVLNNTWDLLDAEEATSGWVKEASSDDRADERAVEHVFRQRFGEKAVAYDPSDPEANKEAMLHGYTVVHGGSLSKDEWTQARRAGALKPAGQVTPTRKPEFAADGKPPMDPADYTPGIRRVVAYSEAIGECLLGKSITVQVHSTTQYFAAAYGHGVLTFNLMRLGHRWFNDPNQHAVDALLLHEFAHDRVSDHLSEAFHDEVCRLGALLREVDFRLGAFR